MQLFAEDTASESSGESEDDWSPPKEMLAKLMALVQS